MSIFSKAFKGLKRVAKIVAKPVAATIARTVVGSVPVLGGVVSAVGAVKHAIHPPTRANTANLSSVTGAPAFGHPSPMRHSRTTGTRARRGSRKRAPAYGGAREARSQGLLRKKRVSSRGSAKQRAARARFAAAAKRGPIRKGQRL